MGASYLVWRRLDIAFVKSSIVCYTTRYEYIHGASMCGADRSIRKDITAMGS